MFVRLEECELGECEGEGSTVHYLAKLPTFYTAPYTTLTIPCRIWGWPGTAHPLNTGLGLVRYSTSPEHWSGAGQVQHIP